MDHQTLTLDIVQTMNKDLILKCSAKVIAIEVYSMQKKHSSGMGNSALTMMEMDWNKLMTKLIALLIDKQTFCSLG